MNQLNNHSFKGTNVKLEPFNVHEQDDIQSKLDRQLGPEYVSTRPGAGGVQVSYIEGWKAINLANQVFGFNGWHSEVKTINVDYLDERGGKFNVGLSIVVRVTLKDGTYHEDIGYGSLDNARTKSMAFEKAKKEAMTDGLKRALRCFGNAMGNCLYDKEYLSKISGVKCAPPDFDETNLFRHTEGPSRSTTIPSTVVPIAPSSTSNNYAPKAQSGPAAPQQRSSIYAPPQQAQQRSKYPPPQANRPSVPEKRAFHEPQQPNKRRDPDDNFDDSLTFSDDLNLQSDDFNDEVNELLNTKLKTPAVDETSENIPSESHKNGNPDKMTNDTPSRTSVQAQEPTQPPSDAVGFFKARVAEEVQKNSPSLSSTHAFNPQFISPSIRRTLDPTKSTPVKRSEIQTKAPIRYDNPKLIPNRQVGKPRVYPPPKKLRDATSAASNGPANDVSSNTNAS